MTDEAARTPAMLSRAARISGAGSDLGVSIEVSQTRMRNVIKVDVSDEHSAQPNSITLDYDRAVALRDLLDELMPDKPQSTPKPPTMPDATPSPDGDVIG